MYTYRHPLPSAEVWPVTWVWSTLLTLKQHERRQHRLAAAVERLSALKERLARPRARRRAAAQLDLQVAQILERYRVMRYLKVERVVREVHTFKQIRRGPPGPDTQYKKLTRKRYDLEWALDQNNIAYDEKSDGMYPLLCNDRSLSPEAVLTAHKGQPTLEKRFEQTKTVHEIAPVFLKSPARIEALFTLYFMVLFVQALIERELRRAMRREKIDSLVVRKYSITRRRMRRSIRDAGRPGLTWRGRYTIRRVDGVPLSVTGCGRRIGNTWT